VASSGPWVSPRDLAEYAYCPRALYYRRRGPAPPSRASEAGEAFHERTLGAERRRDERGWAAWLAVLVGLLLVLAAAAVLLW